ncbi:MAG TPA: amino acid permease [Bryobacteraceae bacterium]|nr:amino acid permease [Bryobacteraceae bacterium]
MENETDRTLNEIVNEVITEAHINPDLILPEEIAYIREHSLKKPLRVVHIWALGVGAVITGMYFGWNFGLPLGGPVGVLIASLIVCGLYLGWVLGLSELSVSMPFAGGPLAYGRRAVGKGFGFIMAWSMFLECLFAGIGTALATGGYVAFLLNPEHPGKLTTTVCAIGCALLFFAIQYVGVREQASIMLWLTIAAIVALVWFWLATIPGVSLDRVLTNPLLPGKWGGVLGALPYALWWLVIIESVALASEEAHEPHVTIPRGMVLAQITLVVLVMLTAFFACAAAPFAETGKVVYPLPLVFKNVWGTGWFLMAFSALALTGMVVSYNGMIYAVSRQSFSLGRAGYLPRALGAVHPVRRTPHVSLAVWTLVTTVFIVFGYFYEQATNIAILISTLAALIWYVLAMICLFVLRHKEPGQFRPYRVPIYPWLPAFIILVSIFSAYLYGWVNVQVIVPTIALYVVAGIWYLLRGRHTVLSTAPEEVAARVASKLAARRSGKAQSGGTAGIGSGGVGLPLPRWRYALERVTAVMLATGIVSLAWMVLRATGWIAGPPVAVELAIVAAIWSLLFVALSLVGLASTLGQ